MNMKAKNWVPWTLAIVMVIIGGYAVGTLSGLLDTHNTGVDRIEYRLKWLPNAGFVGDLYADTYGYYVNAGLRVSVVPGGPDRDALTALLKGDAMFAVASADQVLQAVYRGGTDLKVIAQIYAKNPVQWIYRSSLGPMNRPESLIGKRIGVTVGDNDETIMNAYLKRNGILPSQVILVPVQFDYSPFTSNPSKVDLFPVYTNTQGVELQRQLGDAHEQVGFFDPSTVGKEIHFVANSVVTTSRVIAEHKDIVQRFLHGTLRGWRDALDPNNIEKAAHAVLLATPGSPTDMSTIQQQIAVTRDIVSPEHQQQVGAIDVAAWEDTENTMYQEGLFDNNRQRPSKLGIAAYLDNQFMDVEARSR